MKPLPVGIAWARDDYSSEWLARRGEKDDRQILAKRLDGRFIHNHLLHDVAIVSAGFDGPDRRSVYETVRAVAYQALARRPITETFVMTNALCKNTPREREAWKHVVSLAIRRQVPLVPIVLRLDPEENCRRVQSADRIGKKLTDTTVLNNLFEIDTIQEPDVPERLVLDVTDLSAEQAADQIQAHVTKIRPRLLAATEEHLQII